MSIFYKKEIVNGVNQLSAEESKHCSQVLRHQKGDKIWIFDGIGGKYQAVLTHVSKISCEFQIVSFDHSPEKPFRIHLGIAPTKNTDRMEWLVEKLCEIGADEVTPLITKHSERKKIRLDRLEKKAVSAMKQSRNPFLLQINELTDYQSFISSCTSEKKVIAHVKPSYPYLSTLINSKESVTILIGPEGDFSPDEVASAIECGFKPATLGNNTLRTETAGLIACCMINFKNQY